MSKTRLCAGIIGMVLAIGLAQANDLGEANYYRHGVQYGEYPIIEQDLHLQSPPPAGYQCNTPRHRLPNAPKPREKEPCGLLEIPAPAPCDIPQQQARIQSLRKLAEQAQQNGLCDIARQLNAQVDCARQQLKNQMEEARTKERLERMNDKRKKLLEQAEHYQQKVQECCDQARQVEEQIKQVEIKAKAIRIQSYIDYLNAEACKAERACDRQRARALALRAKQLQQKLCEQAHQ